MALDDEDEAPGIPEWVVTFGDMMSLLLTFFIMLVSLSEMKEEERFQAMVESIKEQFGHSRSTASMVPGNVRPRNSNLKKIANQGRAKRLNTTQGGARVKAPVGDHEKTTANPNHDRTAISVTLYYRFGDTFLNDSADDKEGRSEFQKLVDMSDRLKGMPQVIEVRGHTSARPLRSEIANIEDWDDLSYQRAKLIKSRLVNELGIEQSRIRISVAGQREPKYMDPLLLELNERVEVFVLEESAADNRFSHNERKNKFVEGK